jgi:hypothetical protein
METRPPGPSALVISYLDLRKFVGYLGIALPFVLAFGAMLLHGAGIERSISSYYHTGMRDVFVGTLCAIAVFLLSYRGYERRDDVAGDLACIFAVGVALVPTTPPGEASRMDRLVGALHLALAAAFFLTLAYFSLCLFTKTDPTRAPTPRKRQRNAVYRACGYTMLGALALIALQAVLPGGLAEHVERLDPMFWLEALAIVAFGISWLTKGEAILKDET